ncbi:MAG: cell division protein FtsQ/DivIB [Oscillospiraceae bacterium]
MKEFEKTTIQRISNSKRERRRKRFLPLFYFLVAVLVLVFAVTLSMTVLFNIKTIYIEGSSEYEASQIVEASEIYKGDNLVRLNTELAKQKILKNLMYIDDVTIKKEFPDKVIIQTVASVPAMNISTGDEYILVSEGLKLLLITDTPRENLLNVIGFEPSVVNGETKLQSEDEQKVKILETIYNQLKEEGILSDIVYVDLSDKYNIEINYSNRIFIELGSYSDLEYKIKYAHTVIRDNISTQKSGYLTFVNTNSASFVEKDKYEQYYQNLKDKDITLGDETQETSTIEETLTIIDESSTIEETSQVTVETTEEVTISKPSNINGDGVIVYGSKPSEDE